MWQSCVRVCVCRPTYKNEANKTIPSLQRVYSNTFFCFLVPFRKTSYCDLLTGTYNPHSGQGSQGGPTLGLLGPVVTVSKFLIILSSDLCGVSEVGGGCAWPPTACPPLSTCHRPVPGRAPRVCPLPRVPLCLRECDIKWGIENTLTA